MGKNYRSCIEQMTQAAKRGKTSCQFSIFIEEIEMLEAEGFAVKLPNNYCDAKRAKKLAWEVGISWATPTVAGGMAHELDKLVSKYCNKCNAISRTCQTKVERRAKKAARSKGIDDITCFKQEMS